MILFIQKIVLSLSKKLILPLNEFIYPLAVLYGLFFGNGRKSDKSN